MTSICGYLFARDRGGDQPTTKTRALTSVHQNTHTKRVPYLGAEVGTNTSAFALSPHSQSVNRACIPSVIGL